MLAFFDELIHEYRPKFPQNTDPDAFTSADFVFSPPQQIEALLETDLNALIRGRAEHVPTLPTLRRLSAGLGVAIAIRIDPNGTLELTEAQADDSEKVATHRMFEAAG